jgi:hypothetical protein
MGEPRKLFKHWTVLKNGSIKDENGAFCSNQVVNSFFQAGADSIFSARASDAANHPILEAPAGFHFVKPSQLEHTTHFIRTAELLTNQAPVEFLATTLLRFLDGEVSAVACDTGSIMVLAFSIQALLDRFSYFEKGALKYLAISSFGSWNGVKGTFIPDPTALYLISASTSDRLANQLISIGSLSSRIVTLFYWGTTPSIANVICHLKQRRLDNGRLLLPEIVIHPSERCPLCISGSTPLQLRGEQFLPTGPSICNIQLNLDDAPKWIERFAGSAAGTQAIRVHYGKGYLSRIHEIFIHVEFLCLNEGNYRDRLMQAVSQCVPFGIDRIYVCNDPGASGVLTEVVKAMEAAGAKMPHVIFATDLEKSPERLIFENGAALVIAGCLSSGRTIANLSRLLREKEQNASISYLIALRRTRSEEEQKHLENTLRQTSRGRLRFGFQSVQDIHVPDNTLERESIWSSELDLLRRIFDENPDPRKFPVEIVSARIDQLERSVGDNLRGMSEKLFWPKTSGKELELSPNFAFTTQKISERMSQADVYFVISCMLHKIRSGDGGRALYTTEHRRTLLHPNNFQRFSDGLIQACLLRGSFRTELCFGLNQLFNAMVTSYIQEVIANHQSAKGEAVTEFLLAMALGQIRLDKWGTLAVLKEAERLFDDPLKIEHHLAKVIRSNLKV